MTTNSRRTKALQAFLIITISFLAVDGLDSNWNGNLVWDLFFARIQGPLFIGAHASSLLSVAFMAIYLMVRQKSIIRPGFALLGTVSIHEFMLGICAFIVQFIVGGNFNGDDLSITYVAWISAFLIIGWRVIGSYEKKVWIVLAGIEFAWYWTANAVPIHATNYAVIYFYNLASNVSESVSWFLPVSLWLLPKRLLDPGNFQFTKKPNAEYSNKELKR